MSQNIHQIFLANPTTTFQSNDLMYLGRSPYGATDDFAFTYSSMIPINTKGDLLTFSTVNAKLAVGSTDGQILQVSSGAATGLAWSTPTYPSASGSAGKILRSDGTNNIYSTSTFADTYSASTILYSNGANTVTGLATANSSVLVTTSSGVPVQSGTLTNGQLIIGSTSATPAVATLTAGTNIAITNGAGSITVAASGPAAFSWNVVAGTSQACAVNNGYISSNVSSTSFTLPSTAAAGSIVAIVGLGAGGWVLNAATGQTIRFLTQTTSISGSLSSTTQWDCIEVICVVANTTWNVRTANGNLTVA